MRRNRILLAALGLLFVFSRSSRADNTPTWVRIGPPHLTGTCVFDPGTRQFVVLAPAESTLQVWALDLSGGPSVPSHWSLLPVAGPGPTSRNKAFLFADPAHARLVLYGDRSDPTKHDTWVLSFSGQPAWTPIALSGTPPDRVNPTVLFDPAGARLMIFGGRDPDSTSALSYRNDLWEGTLDGTPAWQPIATNGDSPSPRVSALGVLDSRRGRLLLYGGSGPDSNAIIAARHDLSSLDLQGTWQWESLSTDVTNDPGGDAAFYDSTADRLVLCGDNGVPVAFGQFPPASGQWILVLPVSSPTAWNQLYLGFLDGGDFIRGAALIGLDEGGRRLLVYGGSRSRTNLMRFAGWIQDLNDAWEFHLDSGLKDPLPGAGDVPAGRIGSTLTYDPVSHRYFLIGGNPSWSCWSISADSLQDWRREPDPPQREFHSAIYDPIRKRVLVFGGFNGTVVNDVWALQPGGSWSPLVTSGTPPEARYGHAAIYDPIGDRMVIYGGNNDSHDLDDTWALLLSKPTPTWTKLDGAGPPAMSYVAAVFDPTPGRMIVLGGPGFWSLGLADSLVWSELAPGFTHSYATADYDEQGDRALLYGLRLPAMQDEQITQVYLGASGPSEGIVVTSNLPPWPRGFPTQGFDTDRRSLMAGFGEGGASGYAHFVHYFPDMWTVDLASETTPALASIVSAIADSGEVSVTWLVTGWSSAVTVQRREGSGAWQDLSVLVPDGRGVVAVQDDRVTAGRTYAYRLTFGSGLYAGFVEVSVPATGAQESLALMGAFPNPSPSGLTVSFRLPDAAPARLDLVDTRGRIIRTQQVGMMGAGTHSSRLVPPSGAASGVYFVALTRGSDRLVERVALIGRL